MPAVCHSERSEEPPYGPRCFAPLSMTRNDYLRHFKRDAPGQRRSELNANGRVRATQGAYGVGRGAAGFSAFSVRLAGFAGTADAARSVSASFNGLTGEAGDDTCTIEPVGTR